MDVSLPDHLNERFRWRVSLAGAGAAPGEFVLYWMHNALRGHENPALDVAISLARNNGLPLLVYHGLSEDYPYASDRYHAFMLQGHRDVQRELAERGIAAYFHLQRQGDRGPHLRTLTRQAAVLVTEEMPVQPLARWMERLVHRTETPIAMVDATCVVPVPLVPKAYTRAFEYRDATRQLYAERVDRPYHEQPVDCPMYDGPLPFEPLDLQDLSLSEVIADCQIDHAIAPVSDTPGGSRAGYARWEQFKQHGLSDYAERRNDAADHHGTSRMSAYLHFGMVSPLRIAREASARKADKYLDELLVWRELSFHFCHHNIDVIDSLDAIPRWARETLDAHAMDAREGDYVWEKLARGKTGQPLWDACQRSLLKHGELHNNVRMTWGKAFLPWSKSPNRAMQLTMDLNHRYALDGRDPSSYGGVLWCFGQFDRPFQPESLVSGTVRRRTCEEHQRRLDLNKYCAVVDRPIAGWTPRVAVIGAGLAGLMAARTLADHGLEVKVFEKSSSVGGRMATRRMPDETTVDHGAQYFTVRDPRFARYVRSWSQQGLVQPWMGRIVELASGGEVIQQKLGTARYVGAPTMKEVARHLASDLDIVFRSRIEKIVRDGPHWTLADGNDDHHRGFDMVLANCPPAQASQVLDDHPDFADRISQVRMLPCWAMIVRHEQLAPLSFDGAFINEGPISWIARDAAKPGRHAGPLSDSDRTENWIVHASASWSADHLEETPEAVTRQLMDALRATVGRDLASPEIAQSHRWRYAMAENALECGCLWDPTTGLGACGDWCHGSRIEGAFLSGMAIAGAVLRHITIDRPAWRDEVSQCDSRPRTSQV